MSFVFVFYSQKTFLKASLRDTSNFDKDFTNMPVTFTPIESVIVKAINQDEFKEFSYQNPDWRCLERGEVPEDDANDGRRALRDDLTVNLKQTLPMIPVSLDQTKTNDRVSSTITIVTTDHIPIPHTEAKQNATSTLFQSNSISSSSTLSSDSSSLINAQPKPTMNDSVKNKSVIPNRSTTNETDN